MNDTEHKLEVLASVARRFNRENIIWAVGASLLLYLKGKTEVFHDIDIMLMEPDADRAKAILADMGVVQIPEPRAQYRTRHFWECVVDGVDIDVMAGLVIVSDGKEYDCPLRKEEIEETVRVHGQDIPLHSLSAWKHYYRLMGREDKVKMIGQLPAPR